MFEDSAFEIQRTMSSVTCSVSKRIESRDVTTRIAFGFIQYSRCSNAALLECPIEAHRRRTSTAYAKCLRASRRRGFDLYRSHRDHRLDRRGAACRDEAGDHRDQYGDRGAGAIGQRLQVTERNPHVVAIEANQSGRQDESDGDT